MARRKSAPAPDRDGIRTSIVLARTTHARISALASLRGCSMNAIIVEAAEAAARSIVVVDRRKSPGREDPSAQERGSADAPENLDDRAEKPAA